MKIIARCALLIAQLSMAGNVMAVEPAHPTPLLTQITSELRNRGLEHYAFELTTGNLLTPGFWILPTTQHVSIERFTNDVADMIGRAEKTVDITIMAPLPDGVFLEAIKKGIWKLARDRKQVTVRLLAGNFDPTHPADVKALLNVLQPGVQGSDLIIVAGAYVSCAGTCSDNVKVSLNHSKIIAIDGKEAIVGGHNQWDADYAGGKPIYDLSMHVRGPAAQAAANFISPLWDYTCARNRLEPLTYAFTYTGKSDQILRVCSTYPIQSVAPGTVGAVPILGVARYGAGIFGGSDEHQWSDIVMQRVLESARSKILVSQQDVMLLKFVQGQPFPIIDAMAGLIARGGHVFVLLTNPGVKSAGGNPYSLGTQPIDVALLIRDHVAAKMHLSPASAEVRTRVCSNLHLSPIGRYDDQGRSWFQWDSNHTPSPQNILGNHAKMYMVDDHVFYIGSHNMYPMSLDLVNLRLIPTSYVYGSNQEYGFVVDDATAAQQLLNDYWNPLWRESGGWAVTGNPASCKLP